MRRDVHEDGNFGCDLLQLEEENAKLKKLAVALSLDKAMRQDLLAKALAPSRKRLLIEEFRNRYGQHCPFRSNFSRDFSSVTSVAYVSNLTQLAFCIQRPPPVV